MKLVKKKKKKSKNVMIVYLARREAIFSQVIGTFS